MKPAPKIVRVERVIPEPSWRVHMDDGTTRIMSGDELKHVRLVPGGLLEAPKVA